MANFNMFFSRNGSVFSQVFPFILISSRCIVGKVGDNGGFLSPVGLGNGIDWCWECVLLSCSIGVVIEVSWTKVCPF